jgi:hypothetical protein
VRWNLDTTAVTFSDGEKLYWISGLEVTLGYSSVEVYIAPRFKKGTCEYDAVLEHESKHISADLLLLEEYAARIRAALMATRWATYGEPARVSSADEARQATRTKVSSAIQPIVEELQGKRRRAGQVLDAEESPLMLRNLCGSPS